ncbi:M67 family metallopeptidase [Paenibacillus sp. MMS18-CY102]|uniref:M67 family metallopeptidase n=1 Tax=Paenibacillus sp. MMS18-CY102 TaxID=2682849 RepID=UPI00136643E6|nr:M67 family metallopeptidase [Paenibacillus sp. MMS18-CY102]MWC28923.1 hypothetical protein [Paenibacillus sp. MMS18-CY102]
MLDSTAASTLSLSPQAYASIVSYCQSQLPNEACGLLASSVTSPSSTLSDNVPLAVDVALPIANVHPEPRHAFTFDPQAWINAYYFMMRTNQSLIGYFHSHPTTAPIPSLSDAAGLPQGTDPVMLIVSFAATQPQLSAYRLLSSAQTWFTLTVAITPEAPIK